MAIQAIEHPIFQRAMRVISTISNSNPAIIVTTFDNQYQDGLVVRLVIPPGFGMQQANQLEAPILVINETTFSMAIDTSSFDKFLTTQVIDFTDVSGDASGNIYSQVVVYQQPMPGQSFTIGDQVFLIPVGGGDLITDGDGTGTFNLATGAYTFTGCESERGIRWNPVGFPQDRQFAQVLPTGELANTLVNATQNILPFRGDD